MSRPVEVFLDVNPGSDGLLGAGAEFPTVRCVFEAPPRDLLLVRIDAVEWRDPGFDGLAFDARFDAVDDAPTLRIALTGAGQGWRDTARQILTRYQSRFPRRNAASSGPVFDAILARHREMHDLARPLVRADWLHALDVWQWMLRLSPDASLEVQAAALWHDVERLVSEADVRVEHHAVDYRAFKAAHAAVGARMVRAALVEVPGLSGASADRIATLVARHESPDGDAELALLNDADGLSFFSLNSAGFVRYFPTEHTRRKVAYSLHRMRPQSRAHLREIRHPRTVQHLLMQQMEGSAA